MKNYFILLLLAALSLSEMAMASPLYGKTDEGRDVILESNGTWKYSKILTTKKSPKATKFFKIKEAPFGIWIDPSIWVVSTEKEIDAELKFQLKNGGDALCLMTNEGLNQTYDVMKEFLTDILEESMKDVSLVSEEKRNVNGLPINYMQFEVTFEGDRLTILHYIYSAENAATIRLTVWCQTKQFMRYKPILENYLNGLVRSD